MTKTNGYVARKYEAGDFAGWIPSSVGELVKECFDATKKYGEKWSDAENDLYGIFPAYIHYSVETGMPLTVENMPEKPICIYFHGNAYNSILGKSDLFEQGENND